MGWTSYWVGSNCNRKDECMKYINGFKKDGKPTAILLKSVMKGSSFYALMETTDERKEQFVLCLLTSVSKGEFYYKDIQCNPYEVGGIPMSIVKAFVPSNDKDKEWKEKCIANEATEKKKVSFKIGDILECKNNDYADITWGNGYTVKSGSTFYVKVTPKYNRNKTTKMFQIVEKVDVVDMIRKDIDTPLTDNEIIAKNGGKRYKYFEQPCRIMEKTLKNLPSVKLAD